MSRPGSSGPKDLAPSQDRLLVPSPPRPARAAWWQWALGHHPPESWEHCYLLHWRGRTIPFCARCLGLYPAMFLALFIGAWQGPFVPPWALGAALAVSFLDWASTRLGYRPGTNRWRTLSAMVAGLAVGLAVGERLPLWLEPSQWHVLAGFAAAAVMIELSARWMDTAR